MLPAGVEKKAKEHADWCLGRDVLGVLRVNPKEQALQKEVDRQALELSHLQIEHDKMFDCAEGWKKEVRRLKIVVVLAANCGEASLDVVYAAKQALKGE